MKKATVADMKMQDLIRKMPEDIKESYGKVVGNIAKKQFREWFEANHPAAKAKSVKHDRRTESKEQSHQTQ